MSRLWVWLVVPLVFAVYLVTLSPTVGLIDSGELAAGCRLLNILHPTGYPLYTMLGRLVSMVPVATVVNRVAALSALFAAAGVGLFLLLGLRLGLSRTAAGTGALLLGFSFPVWAVAVDVEVYSLTLVLVLLLWLAAESAERGGPMLILAYLAGLALTNHMSAASTVLGVALTVILAYRRRLARRIPVLALLFLFGISPYVFLVLRARAGPLFAWGSPHNLERFYWHVTGRQYQVWMFTQSFAEVMRNAGRGAGLLARSFLYVLVPVVFYGALHLFRTRRSLAVGLTVSAAAAFAYAVNYSIPDIESYYLPCLAALAVFGVVGLDELVRRVGKWRHAVWVAGLAALALNFGAASKQGDYVALDHATNTLASAEQNATIITDWWDVYSPVFYLQHVEQVRPDVCMIDKELLRRSWYFKYLARAYPWLVERSAAEIAQYREYLDQFEHGRLRDPNEIQRRYVAMLASFVARNPERPAYTTFDADAGTDARELLPGVARVPVGLLFQLRSDGLIPEFDYSKLRVRVPPRQPDMRTRASLERYRFFLLRRAQTLAARGRGAEVEKLVGWYQSLPVSRLAPLPVRQ
ncbi:MAG: DUF2723 domain-containing protein [candidate division WOR-3 bacterium]|nr:DUF2723 domain-containing protein [candidate division WOR-3 bacterium]